LFSRSSFAWCSFNIRQIHKFGHELELGATPSNASE
jgi:hypothetical protein